MNYRDETSTGTILERIRHRRANFACEENRSARETPRRNEHNGFGSSRDDMSQFSNPSPPAQTKKSKYYFTGRPQ